MVVKTAFKVEFHNLFYLQKCFIEENEKSYNIQILLNFIKNHFTLAVLSFWITSCAPPSTILVAETSVSTAFF